MSDPLRCATCPTLKALRRKLAAPGETYGRALRDRGVCAHVRAYYLRNFVRVVRRTRLDCAARDLCRGCGVSLLDVARN